MLNSLLLYPDHPFEIGEIYGTKLAPATRRKVPFLISRPRSLSKNHIYGKEQKLIE
jgi:hypothetical protein